MKLIIVVGPNSFDGEIKNIFEESEIQIYSRSDITGHSNKGDYNLSENWFAISNGYQKSIVFFSFTEEEKAKKVLEAANLFNGTLKSKSQLRAFIMSVEDHN